MSEDTEPSALVPVKRKVGRPRKTEATVAPPKKKKRLLPVLKVDLTRDPSEQTLQYTEVEQARHLGWKTAEVRSVNAQLGLTDSLPMVCQASGCFYASQCPTRPDFKFKGYLCPLQTMDVYRYFLGYVVDLDIQPTDYVDLRLVEDLVRIDLQLKTVDQQIQMTGLETDTVGGVLQMAGKAIFEKTAHPLLLHQDKLRNRRRDIHKSLIASRAEKWDRDRKEGKAREDTLSIMDKILNTYETRTKAKIRETTDTFDAEFTSEDEEENEE
jgi:hypothetical protein